MGKVFGFFVIVLCVLVALVIMAVVVVVNAATNNTREINGQEYKVYGLLNEDDEKLPCIDYDADLSNIVIGSVFVETIVAPVYFFGFSIFEPVGVKQTEECLSGKAPNP